MKDILSKVLAVVFFGWQDQSIYPSIKYVLGANLESGIAPVLCIGEIISIKSGK